VGVNMDKASDAINERPTSQSADGGQLAVDGTGFNF